MMKVIDFSKADCRNCYRCVRECPVKAIRVKDEQAQIVDSLCIGCGRCLRVCPKNAKQINSELSKVKQYIEEKEVVVASVAPSFIAAFNIKEGGQFVTALKQLGFTYVELTAVGAAVVSEKYNEYYRLPNQNIYISTSCPSSNYLIQKYYPHLIEHMIPVASPMVCHGRMLKKKYGRDIKTVFIGPCLAKKIESKEEQTVDSVLTFDELSKWFVNEEIDLLDLKTTNFDHEEKAAHLYPVAGGIIDTLDKSAGEEGRQVVVVDGIHNCMDLLKCIEKGMVSNAWVEMSLCSNSCINGPAMPEEAAGICLRKNRVQKYAHSCDKGCSDIGSFFGEQSLDIDVTTKFKDLSEKFEMPNEDEMKEILSSIGKLDKADELNCGACGYNTCRDKAAAVYNGMAEKNMCLPYMRQRAETLSNIIFDVTPNIIFILSEELKIIGFNPAAENLFRVKKHFAMNKPITLLMEAEDFIQVRDTKENIKGKKIFLKDFNAVMLQTVLYLYDHKAMLVIMSDITSDEIKEKKLQKVKMNTLNMAQEVIDKQMRVAQEIASLLGETTAETKVILTKLKKVVEAEEDGLK